MERNSEYTKKIWEMKIPIIFKIPSRDLQIQIPASRISYLPQIYAQIDEILERIDQPKLDYSKTWCSFENKSLKWHLPIGLLYDQNRNVFAPWTLILNESNCPSDLFIWDSDNCLYDIFMSSFKEADYIRYGSIKKVMGLALNDTTSLWEAIAKGDHDQYFKIQDTLIKQDEQWKSIPIRFYYKGQMIRQLVKIQDTLQDVLSLLDIAPQKLISHSVVLEPDTPIEWLALNFAYSDSFVHIVII
ncbi:autophagy protein 5 [Boothiomyces sp. JEL0866]|nr:autophagy protein 5 [Boothiomyces sp. JEL0866]